MTKTDNMNSNEKEKIARKKADDKIINNYKQSREDQEIGANLQEEKITQDNEEKSTDIKDPSERIAILEKENRVLKDNLLRKQADYENFRKRIQREKEEAIKYANSMLLLDIASVIDDFERAIKSAQKSEDFASFHSGVALIEKQLLNILEKKWGLERFVSLGEPFNPDRHEAIMAEEKEDVDTPVVLEDFQSGYLLNGRVLRPAKVKVVQPLSSIQNKQRDNSNNDNISETSDNKNNGK